MVAQQLSWVLSSKKTLAPAEGPGVWFAAKVAKGELNPVFFIFDPKTQKPNSAVRPSVKSRRRSAKAGNQLGSGWHAIERAHVLAYKHQEK